MYARCAIALFVVVLSVDGIFATPVITVGEHELVENTPDQVIELMVSGGDPVQGLTFRIQVADGGTDPRVGGSIDGPAIKDVNLIDGTIFEGNNTGQSNVLSFDQIWVNITTTQSGTVAADGVLARITVDTTGFAAGNDFPLVLKETRDGATDFAGIQAEITDGLIRVVPVPEPASMAIGIFASLAWMASRRRRRR